MPVEKGRASLFQLRSIAFLLAVSALVLVAAADALARPQTTNPSGYYTIRVGVTEKAATLSPNHCARGQVGVFLVTNRAKVARVFILGKVTLTTHKSTGFAIKLAPNEQKRVLLMLDFRGKLPVAVGTVKKTTVVGNFTVT